MADRAFADPGFNKFVLGLHPIGELRELRFFSYGMIT